jgi:hypothetical protein
MYGLTQWKATRNQAVVNTKVQTETQTDDRNTQIDETTQSYQQNSHDLEHNEMYSLVKSKSEWND